MKNQSKQDQDQGKVFEITIRSKEKLLYKGVGKTISSENEEGPFDVLYSHANFISLIFNYIIIDRGLPTELSFQLEKGVVHVAADKIQVYVGL
jgi:F0F1-type ATP synthase epsilon subunit